MQSNPPPDSRRSPRPHADALLLGEEEGIWEDLLADFQTNTLKPRYQRTSPVDLTTVRPFPTNLIPPSKYNWF